MANADNTITPVSPAVQESDRQAQQVSDHYLNDAKASVGEPSAVNKQPYTLQKIADALSNLRSVCASLIIIILSAILIVSAVKALLQDVVMIEPVNVPHSLMQRGYTPEVVADRLMEATLRIRTDIMSQKEGHVLAADWLQADFQVPGGMSVKSMLAYLRELLGLSEKKIGGEVTLNGDLMQLRLRLALNEDAARLFSVEAADINQLIRKAAETIIETSDPYLMAYYLANKEPDRSMQLLAHCLENSSPEDDVWAHNLQGLIYLQQNKLEKAAEKFQQAIDIDPQFPLAYSNWGLLKTYHGQYEEADLKFKTATEYGPDLGIIYNGWGFSYAMRRDEENVKKMFEQAIKLESENPRIYFSWGVSLDMLGYKDVATEKFQKALSMNAEFIEANIYVADRYYRDRNYANAVKHYDIVENLSPYYAEVKRFYHARALSAWGDMFEKQGDITKAIEKYEQANARNPGFNFERRLKELRAVLVSM